jgi:hypothetical protein
MLLVGTQWLWWSLALSKTLDANLHWHDVTKATLHLPLSFQHAFGWNTVSFTCYELPFADDNKQQPLSTSLADKTAQPQLRPLLLAARLQFLDLLDHFLG